MRSFTCRQRRGTSFVVCAASALLLAGCGQSAPPPAPPLLLAGPNTDITVVIPPGWHQVINSSSPSIPEMVAPTTCMGSQESTCAIGLARIATLSAPDAPTAERTVQQAILASPHVTPGATVSQGPGKVGNHDGYRHRFTFSNPTTALTSEIAVTPSGPAAPDRQGNHEYSVILAWVSNSSGAPGVTVLDQIIGSAQITGGQAPARR